MSDEYDRLLELAGRLTKPGAKAAHVSASELHEIADGIHDLVHAARARAAEATAYMTPEHAVTALLGPHSLASFTAKCEAAKAAVSDVPVGEYRQPEICGADNSIPFEPSTIGERCKNTKPCPDHDDSGERRRPWNS